MKPLEFTLNGQPCRVVAREGESLLDALRERCGIRSIKNGCAPQGQCGACVAIIDGHAKVTCAMPAEAARGREILTLEGLPPEYREQCARAFAAAGAVQCGFCLPGFALRAKHLLDRNPSPGRRDIARAIDGHLCRCTGYVKVIDAIEWLARARRGEKLRAAESRRGRRLGEGGGGREQREREGTGPQREHAWSLARPPGGRGAPRAGPSLVGWRAP